MVSMADASMAGSPARTPDARAIAMVNATQDERSMNCSLKRLNTWRTSRYAPKIGQSVIEPSAARAGVGSERKADDRLDRDVVGAAREAPADGEVEVPAFQRNVERGEQGVGLLAPALHMRGGAELGVVLHADRDAVSQPARHLGAER